MKDRYSEYIRKTMENNKRELSYKTRSLSKELRNELYKFVNHQNIRKMLKEGNHNTDEMYIYLTYLVESPTIEYIDIFQKIRDLNLNAEINELVTDGLEKIANLPRDQ